MPLTKKGKKIRKAMHKQYGKKKGEEVFYASANKGTIKGVHGEDINKYATEEEKEMLKENMKSLIEKYGTNEEKQFLKEAGVYDLPVDPDFTRKRLAKKQLRKTLGSAASPIEGELSRSNWLNRSTFLSPFDKSGQPRQYLKILLALEDNPEGLTKMEIFNDVLGKGFTKEQARSWGTYGLWAPLVNAKLIEPKKVGKVTKYFTGPKWPEYRKNILGLDELPADEPPEVTQMAQEMDDAQYPQGHDYGKEEKEWHF